MAGAIQGIGEAYAAMPYVLPYIQDAGLDADRLAPGVQFNQGGKPVTVPGTGGTSSSADSGMTEFNQQIGRQSGDPRAKQTIAMSASAQRDRNNVSKGASAVGSYPETMGGAEGGTTAGTGGSYPTGQRTTDTIAGPGASGGSTAPGTPGGFPNVDVSGSWLNGLTDIGINSLDPSKDPDAFVQTYLNQTRGVGTTDPFQNALGSQMQAAMSYYPMLRRGTNDQGSLAEQNLFGGNILGDLGSADGQVYNPAALFDQVLSDENLADPAMGGTYVEGQSGDPLDAQFGAMDSMILNLKGAGASDAYISALYAKNKQAQNEYRQLAMTGKIPDNMTYGQWAKQFKGADAW
jgi:hypothetical protein